MFENGANVLERKMIALTYLQNRYTLYSSRQAEEFSTASRNVKPGLIAAGIVSSWTWPGTLLTSSTVTTLYGISGPFTWACFGCFQISLFALLAIQIKRTVPGAHTYPEMVLAKHGRAAHVTYLFYGLITNVLVGASLVLGGSQVVAAVSGVNVYAANFIVSVPKQCSSLFVADPQTNRSRSWLPPMLSLGVFDRLSSPTMPTRSF